MTRRSPRSPRPATWSHRPQRVTASTPSPSSPAGVVPLPHRRLDEPGRARCAPSPADPAELRIAAASLPALRDRLLRRPPRHRRVGTRPRAVPRRLHLRVRRQPGRRRGRAQPRRAPRRCRLADYRARYAQYLGDPDLQASRAACPWVVIWDDHEVENNYAGVAPEDIADMPTFAVRRLRRLPGVVGAHAGARRRGRRRSTTSTIYRTIAWGGLADLIMLDGRKYRTDQACDDVVASPRPAVPDGRRTGADDARRRAGAVARPISSPRRPRSGRSRPADRAHGRPAANGAVLNYDQWDGYGRPASACSRRPRSPSGSIVLTGDIHLAGVGVLPGVGVEFVSTSICSSGLVPADLPDVVGTLGDIVAAELAHRGYTRHIVTPETWTAEFRIVDDVTDPASPVSTWRTFVVEADRDVVVTGVTFTALKSLTSAPWRSRPIPGRPTSRCSTRRSAPTWRARSRRTARHEALVARHQGIRWTYDEFGERVDRSPRA